MFTEEYTEILFATSHNPIVIMDHDFYIKKANSHFYNKFGFIPSETEGNSLFSIGNSAWNIPELNNLFGTIITNTQVENYEVNLTFPGQESKALLLNARQATGKNKDALFTFLVIEDITEKKKAASERLEIENRFRLIADNAPVLIWLAGTDKLCHFFNKGWLDFTGRDLGQELGNGWTQGVHPEDYARWNEVYNENFDAQKAFYIEYRLKRHDGEYRWISGRGVPSFDPDGTFGGYVGSCMDIHHQKNFADTLEKQVQLRTKELEQSRSFLNSVLSSTYYGIASYEPIRDVSGEVIDFRIIYTNQEVPGNFGLSIKDVIGKTFTDVYPGIFENGIFQKIKKCLLTGIPDTYEIAVTEAGKPLWLSAAMEKVNDTVTVTSKNITNEKEAALNLERMNELLFNKNKELSSFTYIASHDLQEPLRKIRMFISRITEEDGKNFSDGSIAYFQNINATAGRMQNLIDALLSYSSMDSDKMHTERTDLNKLMKEVLGMMDVVIEEKNVILEIDHLPTVQVVRIQFQQLFLNLLNNAMKYRKTDVKPIIKISAEKVTDDKNKFWKISVKDNGIGFDPQYKDRIFEVFQRLHGKKEFEGTGVGLAICQKIIHNHHGYITAEGKPGDGAVFSVFLPSKT